MTCNNINITISGRLPWRHINNLTIFGKLDKIKHFNLFFLSFVLSFDGIVTGSPFFICLFVDNTRNQLLSLSSLTLSLSMLELSSEHLSAKGHPSPSKKNLFKRWLKSFYKKITNNVDNSKIMMDTMPKQFNHNSNSSNNSNDNSDIITSKYKQEVDEDDIRCNATNPNNYNFDSFKNKIKNENLCPYPHPNLNKKYFIRYANFIYLKK